MENYYPSYLKYKKKYLELKKIAEGGSSPVPSDKNSPSSPISELKNEELLVKTSSPPLTPKKESPKSESPILSPSPRSTSSTDLPKIKIIKKDDTPRPVVMPKQEDSEALSKVVNFFSEPKDIISPALINSSFDRKTMHKVIDGKKYNSIEELKKNKLKCFFETCDLSWENADWVDR